MLTWSVVPDGTVWSGGTSALYSTMTPKDPAWHVDLARAIGDWGAALGLVITEVKDSGVPIGADGQQGQIRIGGVVAEPTVLGWSYYPGPSPIDGDVTFNVSQDWANSFDLYSSALHEFGHAVADLNHGDSPVMAPAYQGTLTGLSAADVTAGRKATPVTLTPLLVFNKVAVPIPPPPPVVVVKAAPKPVAKPAPVPVWRWFVARPFAFAKRRFA